MTIVTKFGKFRYNQLPMRMCTSEYIFQSKAKKFLVDTKGNKTLFNDIMVLSNYKFAKHIDHRRVIFYGPHTAGMKVNATR